MMKKKFLLIFPVIVLWLLLFSPVISLALDEGGCLKCHQYPGLARLEKSGRFKALHIDENDFFKSPHGKFRCKECHITILTVSHSPDTARLVYHIIVNIPVYPFLFLFPAHRRPIDKEFNFGTI